MPARTSDVATPAVISTLLAGVFSPYSIFTVLLYPLLPWSFELFPPFPFFFSYIARDVYPSTAAAAAHATAWAAADARRRVRAATWETKVAEALSRKISIVIALTDASVGWVIRDHLGDAVEQLVEETYVETAEFKLDLPVKLVPAGS